MGGPDEEFKIHDVTTTLKSELAAMQYKRDRLLNELQEIKVQLKTKEDRCLELQNETEELKEQAARQNSIIASLRSRIQELEERERTLNGALSRTEMNVETLSRENRYQMEKIKDLELKTSHLDVERETQEQTKKQMQKNIADLVRRLSSAIGSETVDFTTTDAILLRANELIQDITSIRTRSMSTSDSLSNVEKELKMCREILDKTYKERDSLQRQATSHLIEIDRYKQEKELLEKQLRTIEMETTELREKCSTMARNWNSASSDITSQEILISNLRDEVKLKEEKVQEIQNEMIHLLESLAIITSTPTRFVEPQSSVIKERVREIVHECKDLSIELEDYKAKYAVLSQQNSHEREQRKTDEVKLKSLEEERKHLENRLHKLDSELTACEIAKESLKRDKAIFVTFLEKLSRTLNVDEISKEIGVDLHTESILLRAQQLAKAEAGKICDKSAVVFQLQRRVRTLRDQLQRRDLHLDLLRKKLSMQEDNTRMRSLLEAEKEEASIRIKKSLKQIEKLQSQLIEARSVSRDLRTQLTDAEEYRTKALERSQQIEDLQKRLVDAEMLKTRYMQKANALKEQLSMMSETSEQDKTMNEHTIKLLKEELISMKQNLAECHRAESTLSDFRRSIVTLLGLDPTIPDYEIVSRLSKLINAHREYTLVSKRYDEPYHGTAMLSPRYSACLDLPAVTAPTGHRFSSTADRPRYIENLMDDIDADINAIYNKRPNRTL